jgi:hypothetical protein
LTVAVLGRVEVGVAVAKDIFVVFSDGVRWSSLSVIALASAICRAVCRSRSKSRSPFDAVVSAFPLRVFKGEP